MKQEKLRYKDAMSSDGIKQAGIDFLFFGLTVTQGIISDEDNSSSCSEDEEEQNEQVDSWSEINPDKAESQQYDNVVREDKTMDSIQSKSPQISKEELHAGDFFEGWTTVNVVDTKAVLQDQKIQLKIPQSGYAVLKSQALPEHSVEKPPPLPEISYDMDIKPGKFRILPPRSTGKYMLPSQPVVDRKRVQESSGELLVIQNDNAPVWTPDEDTISCMLCRKQFSLFNRRVRFFFRA